MKSGRHDQKFYADLWQTITSGKVWKGRMTNKRKDGSLCVEDATISPVIDIQGRVTNFVAIKEDVTAELEMEDRLHEPKSFDLVLCDQTMPGMTGVDLSLRILQIRPDMAIIFCTGQSNRISEDKAKSMGTKGFAMKPLTKKDIAVLIRKVLDRG